MENTYRRARALAQAKAYEMVDSDPRFNESWFGRLTRILGFGPLCPRRRWSDNVCELCPLASPASPRWVVMLYTRTEAEHREIWRAHLRMRPTMRSFKAVLAEMPYFEDDDIFDAR